MEPDDVLQSYAEAWGELRDLIQSTGWEVFIDRLRYELDLHQRRIMAGRLDPAEYQRECGVIAGLQLAVTAPERVRQEYEQRLGQQAEQNGDGQMVIA